MNEAARASDQVPAAQLGETLKAIDLQQPRAR